MKPDTIAALATPHGEGGVAMIRVSGPRAIRIASAVFAPKSGSVKDFGGYTVHYGEIVDAGAVVDDAILTVFRAPRSYTAEDVVEISCHAGPATAACVLRLAIRAGARPAEPGEFTQRAFLNGRIDLAQAEAVADLVRARSDSARRVARRQMEGSLSRAVCSIKDELVGILAAIEVTIDFSDEVGDLDYDQIESRIRQANGQIDRLRQSAGIGRALRSGWHAAIVGRPNVGKSSLLNALLRCDRAIVTAQPGTTRDTIEESVTIDGIPVVLTDTAGIRNPADEAEQLGIQRSVHAITMADVALFVMDAAEGVTQDDMALLQRTEGPAILVLNKCDLVPSKQVATMVARAVTQTGISKGIGISALREEGIRALEALIVQGIGGGSGIEAADSVVVSAERHLDALVKAGESLGHAQGSARERMPADFIAIDVRGAIESLGVITGETATEEIIHRIFHDFCVGK